MMLDSLSLFRCRFALGLVLLAGGCASSAEDGAEVDAQQRDGVWVFTYAEAPIANDDALGTGRAAVVDDCLWMGDAVVVWHDRHLTDVDDVIARVLAGEALDLQVGGGGLSLAEGSTVDDFPAVVSEHCSASEIWFSADSDLTIEEAPEPG
jgi:hypothetical protein